MRMGIFVSDYTLANETLERLAGPDTGIILVANGVYHATIKEGGKVSAVLSQGSEHFALSEDLKTRGLGDSEVNPKVKVVDYAGLVDVVFQKFEKIVWL